jgi:YfiH family protein
MVHTDMANLLLYPDWPAPANVKAVSSTRLGGVSVAGFSSLNLGAHVGDDLVVVNTNRQRFSQLAALPAEPVWLNQVHGTQVLQLPLATQADLTADASYSRQADQVCLVMTADCLPLLLCNRAGTEVAAVHAGWRGLAAGVIEQTLTHFQSPVSELLVWLGPAIGPHAFEVGLEVRSVFVAQDPLAAAAFVVLSPEKYLADLYQLARLRLQHCGVMAIYGAQYCTYSDPARFFSYRRDGQTGRQASAIWLERSS